MKGNIIVGQSGGPTAAINSSLAGVYRTAIDRGAKKSIRHASRHSGSLKRRLYRSFRTYPDGSGRRTLKRTPAAYLGSCRYKLPEIHEDIATYDKIFSILDKLEIECFIYIGGNDSMDTIKKLSDYAILRGHPTKFLGVPKTIDNDLALTDHTPGYGSAAKYIGTSVKEIIQDNQALIYDKGLVTIVEIMGRNAGWLVGAAALSKGEDCDGPDLIYVPELPFDIDNFLVRIKELLAEKTFVVVAVSEGIRLADGRYVCELTDGVDFVDAFGHKQLTGTANYLARRLAQEIGCKTRTIELSSMQRAASHLASRIDILEAFQVGGAAVKAADEGDTGEMVIIKRLSDDPYQSTTDLRNVHKVSNVEKSGPEGMDHRGRYLRHRRVYQLCPPADPGVTCHQLWWTEFRDICIIRRNNGRNLFSLPRRAQRQQLFITA